MAAKSQIARGLLFGAEFFTELAKQLRAKGLTDERVWELMARKFKTGSGLAEKVAKMIVGEGTQKAFFFGSRGPVELFLGPSFKNWVFPEIPEIIPDFEGNLRHLDLAKPMSDSEIQKEQGYPKPFTVTELAAVLISWLLKQPNGEKGQLLNNGCVNIFHVQLKDGRVVAIGVWLECGGLEGELEAFEFNFGRWSVHSRAFFRSRRRARRRAT